MYSHAAPVGEKETVLFCGNKYPTDIESIWKTNTSDVRRLSERVPTLMMNIRMCVFIIPIKVEINRFLISNLKCYF